MLKQYAYGYDLAGNRTSEQIDTGMSQATFNNLNQLTSRTTGSGSMEFAGSLDKQGTVAVGGNSATVNHTTTNFVGYASVTSGTNVVPIVATDYNNNARTNKYQLVVTNNGVAKTITFDLNGNETNVVTATSTNTYQWDAANRLMSVTGPTNQSLFTYDGLGRRVQIIEKTNGVAYATNTFVWCGQELCEQRDLTGTNVTKRFFGGGEQMSGTNYFFTRDHLGSVREMTDGTGAIKVRYDYDPYGRQTKISGTMDADFGYAGMYYHAVSGLNLTLYRAYDSDLGRWPNHDPIQELGGLNLYGYVANNPINYYDPLGLALTGQPYAMFGGGAGSVTINGTSYVVTTLGQFNAALQNSTAGGGLINTLTYYGHSSPDDGGLAWAANKDPITADGYISPQNLQKDLEQYKNLFNPAVKVKLKSCGSANPNVFSSADAFKSVFPQSTVSGYTGLYLPYVGGVWNNAYFSHGMSFPNTPYSSSWITK